MWGLAGEDSKDVKNVDDESRSNSINPGEWSGGEGGARPERIFEFNDLEFDLELTLELLIILEFVK